MIRTKEVVEEFIEERRLFNHDDYYYQRISAMNQEGKWSGKVIQSERWPEPIVLKLVEDFGNYVQIVGAYLTSWTHVEAILTKEEFESLSAASISADFTANPRLVFLGLEAKRYRFASLYDPLLAVNISKIDPLPHQIEAVYGYVLNLPRIRFLIADDPGAGKTIMAGLIIKELKLRHQVKRILIVAPGHLKDQWRREMKHRFEEVFVIVDRHSLDSLIGENVWERENQIITSLDFAKQDDILPSISSATYDLIVVDEAHKMSAYQYGEDLTKTIRYRLGEVLSRITEHLLFLTATPHKGDPENFRLFLDLLEPGFFATTEMLQDSIENNDNPLFIRRVKEDLKDFDGVPLFVPRHVKTIGYNLGVDSPREKELYNALYDYVVTQYNKALSKNKRSPITFALIILQRRFASSMYALYRSLQRREERLKNLLSSAIDIQYQQPRYFNLDEIEDMSEEDRWHEEELWETLSVAENREELNQEIATLERLMIAADDIMRNNQELKLRQLKGTLDNLNDEFPTEKVIIFTESKDTLDYLERRILSWGYSVTTIHGSMRLEDRINAEGVFKQEKQILVATEAAGEGINLQFCHLMINYDIPWNPNRLEQRMGRIHRYGQTREVHIFNLVARDTREGRVMTRLFEKLEEIRAALGSDKVYDVLSMPLYGVNLSDLLQEAATTSRNIDEILKDLDITVDEEYISSVKEQLGESLATHFIDYTMINEMAEQAEEHRLIPEYTEAFFKKVYDHIGGRIKERKDGFLTIENVPTELRRVAENDTFKRLHGEVLKKYNKATFDKKVYKKDSESEFISFGHPLFEAAMAWIEDETAAILHRGACFTDPDGALDGLVLFFEGEIRDGKGKTSGSRLFTLFKSMHGNEFESVNPTILWDLVEGGQCESDGVDIESLKRQALPVVIEELRKYQQMILDERKRQAEIKEKYGLASLDYLIRRLDGELIDLDRRLSSGEDVGIVIRNKKARKDQYGIARGELRTTIKQERSLTMSTPRFVGVIRTVPRTGVAPPMESDKEIELIGMRVAMQFEIDSGRTPVDVSAENVGYDLRSTGKNSQKRYIEVKARAQMGEIVLTQNEWFKAMRFKENYYIYAVLNTSNAPRLFIIQNPTETLLDSEFNEMVRYRIPLDTLLSKGEGINEK